MEKRAVVTKFTTPELKKGSNILKKNAEAFNDFMDKILKEPSALSMKASEEDEKTFEEESR